MVKVNLKQISGILYLSRDTFYAFYLELYFKNIYTIEMKMLLYLFGFIIFGFLVFVVD